MARGLIATVQKDIVLYGALAANIGIGIAKFVAAGISGSSSMLTEGFHSCVDSLNQILLLYGQKRAETPPDDQHPFGYGRELYFWAFVVAILIFAVGAGLSIVEGWQHIRHPEELGDATLNYIVLGVSFAMEGASWTIAVREFAATKGDQGWWQAIHRSKDPAGFVVLFEDSAAIIGLAVAGMGIWASHHFADPRIDGVASIVIGVVLGGVSILLAREAKGLLIGERAHPATIGRIRAMVEGEPGITAVNHVRTVHTAPNKVFVAMSVDFDDAMTMGRGETLVTDLERRLRDAVPDLASIYIRPERRDPVADPA